MSRMKHLLRKLHIGGGINDHHRLAETRPVLSPTTTPNVNSSSASPTPSSGSVGIVASNESIADRTLLDVGSDKGVDFNLLEEEFQVQLALAISASDPDGREDPDSAQIDAAKQMSLGFAASVTDTKALVEFQSLRYWNYNVVDYEEKVMDGFYDVYGIASNSIGRGKMPLLVDLETLSISKSVDYEVILVNRLLDPTLQQLEKTVYSLSLEYCVSQQGMVLSGLLQKIADIVVNRMGGPVGDADDMLRRWATRSYELKNSLKSVVLPLGCLDVGLSRHRALLFKVLADRINLPCMLVKGSYYTGTDDGAVNLVKIDDGSEYIIDLMGAPGTLIPSESPSTHILNSGFDLCNVEKVIETPQATSFMLDDGIGLLSPQLGGISIVGSNTSETSFGDMNLVPVDQTDRLGPGSRKHKSCESSSNIYGKPSSAQKMQVKDVSRYVLNAAKNPEFAQKLHAVLLESGASPPPDLFTDISSQDAREEKVTGNIHQVKDIFIENAIESHQNKLFLGHGTSLVPSHGMHVESMNFGPSFEWKIEQKKGLEAHFISPDGCLLYDTTREDPCVINKPMQADTACVEKVPVSTLGMHKENIHESSLSSAIFCQQQTEVALIGNNNKNLQSRSGGASNCSESGMQLMETSNRGFCSGDDDREKVNPVLGDAAEWEIPWEDLHIGERIGIGSYGEVYHADWNGTEVAVKKFLDQDFSGDALVQFKCEVEIMLRLRHPNVVLFMGAVTRPPHLSILTEFLPRGSLYRLLHRSKFSLDEKRRMRMAHDVAKGMNYLHTSHPTIVHRDLKSPNLLVDRNWVVKVCDFGLSRIKHHTFLSSKSTAGTPEWMAPEVLRNEPANEKCDVYSFGVILWELATLRIPWKGLNPMQVVGAVGFQNRRLDIPEDVDTEVAEIIRDCWQTEPQLRPSFAQLMCRLRRLQHQVVGETCSTN